jgi:glycerophosphoryl diester phosphodiesterase
MSGLKKNKSTLVLKFGSVFLLLSLVCSCKQELKEIPKNLHFGHRGSGAHVYNDLYIENTIPSILNALNNLDGCEIDIQMSKNGTIWVYHDDNLNHFCDSTFHPVCIPQSEDQFIASATQCREGLSDKVYKLEDVFKLFSNNNFEGKYLSLDVKGYFEEACFEGRNAPINYFIDMASSLVEMAEKYKLTNTIILETPYQEFLDEVKKRKPEIRCHLLADKEFIKTMEKAIEKNYDGISYSMFSNDLNKQNIETARSYGLEVQLWPINNQETLEEAIHLEPFAFQLSKVTFKN